MRAQVLGFAEETGTNGQPGGRAPCLRECLWLFCEFNEACSGEAGPRAGKRQVWSQDFCVLTRFCFQPAG